MPATAMGRYTPLRENGYNKLDDIVDQEYERAGLSDRLTGGMAKQIFNPW